MIAGRTGDFRDLSKTIGQCHYEVLSLATPSPPFSTTRHSHSIVLKHDNALIYRGKSFR